MMKNKKLIEIYILILIIDIKIITNLLFLITQ